jgi:hypothetical protein
MENIFYTASGLFLLFFIIAAVIVGGVFIFVGGRLIKMIIQRISEKRYNDKQPVSTKDAKISSKRTIVTSGISGGTMHTFYFATFEFAENKERLEFRLPSKEYGVLAEGDLGKLTFQGTRYLQFQRIS